MNEKRLRKQVAYAVGFFAVLLLLVLGPVLLFRATPTRSTPTPAPTAQFLPIKVESVDVITHETTVDVVARLHNPNARAGIVHYPVNFLLFDSANTEMARVPVESNILPGSIQYVLALDVAVPRAVARVTLDTPTDPVYTALSSTITLPSFTTFLVERVDLTRGGVAYTEQKGVVTNKSAFDWQHVEVVAVAFDANNKVIGVGTTLVGRLTSGENREFTILWPTAPAPVARVVTLATTNIFKEDNIIRAVGDPNLLR